MYKVFGKQGIKGAIEVNSYKEAEQECKKMALEQKTECHVYKGEQWQYSYNGNKWNMLIRVTLRY